MQDMTNEHSDKLCSTWENKEKLWKWIWSGESSQLCVVFVQDRVRQEWWDTRCLATACLETQSTLPHAWNPQAYVRDAFIWTTIRVKKKQTRQDSSVLFFQLWESTPASPPSTFCKEQTVNLSMKKEERRTWRWARVRFEITLSNLLRLSVCIYIWSVGER